MKGESFRLVLFTTDSEQIATIRSRFTSSDNISVQLGTGITVTAKHHLDAMWLTPMQASYIGITALVPNHKAAVFPVPEEQRALGLPPLAIVGVNLESDDSREPLFLTRLCITALVEAVKNYNRMHPKPIQKVGSTPENLCLLETSPPSVFQAIRDGFQSEQSEDAFGFEPARQIA